MAIWSWQLTDSAFNPVGEILNAKEMKLALPLNKINTASFNIRLDNPLASTISTDLGFVKIYREKVLLFFGPIITVAEVGEGDNATMQVNCSGPEWIFSQRLCGRTYRGGKFLAANARSAKFVEELVARNIDAELHIDYTTGPISGGSTAIYETTPFRTLAEVLNDLSNTAEGFDWEVYPVDNYSAGEVKGTKIGRLVIANAITTARPNAVFEWGIGRNNISSFTRNIDRSTLTNRAYNFTSGGPEAPGAPTVVAESAESIAKWGLQEDLISAAIQSTELRQALVNENIEVRKEPRQTIVFQPVTDDGTGRVPTLTKDFNVGDSVRVRIVLNGSTHFDAMVRVWGAEYALDENLKETQTLTLSNTV